MRSRGFSTCSFVVRGKQDTCPLSRAYDLIPALEAMVQFRFQQQGWQYTNGSMYRPALLFWGDFTRSNRLNCFSPSIKI